jgi:hypothetical protein
LNKSSNFCCDNVLNNCFIVTLLSCFVVNGENERRWYKIFVATSHFLWLVFVVDCFCLSGLEIKRTVLSFEPVANIDESGAHATEVIVSVTNNTNT